MRIPSPPPPTTVEYYIVEAAEASTLIKCVNVAIAEGYRPHGSMVADRGGFYQPMTRVKVLPQRGSEW